MKEKNVLVIDNIDSFVYNLVQYVGILGADPIVIQNTAEFEGIKSIIKEKDISHIIISPGPKTPKEAGISNEIIEKFGKEIPTLGVCLGHQCIGYVFGGKIRRAKTLKHGKTSKIQHNGKGIFRNLANPLVAIRYHSLVIDKDSCPACLEVTAESEDDHEIMAVSHTEYPIYGVQFHPESILTRQGMDLMRNFLEVKK